MGCWKSSDTSPWLGSGCQPPCGLATVCKVRTCVLGEQLGRRIPSVRPGTWVSDQEDLVEQLQRGACSSSWDWLAPHPHVDCVAGLVATSRGWQQGADVLLQQVVAIAFLRGERCVRASVRARARLVAGGSRGVRASERVRLIACTLAGMLRAAVLLRCVRVVVLGTIRDTVGVYRAAARIAKQLRT